MSNGGGGPVATSNLKKNFSNEEKKGEKKTYQGSRRRLTRLEPLLSLLGSTMVIRWLCGDGERPCLRGKFIIVVVVVYL